MAKSASKRAEKPDVKKTSDLPSRPAKSTSFDPGLASLFASSLGPVKPPPKSRYHDLSVREKRPAEDASEDEEEDDDEDGEDVSAESESEEESMDDVDAAQESVPSSEDESEAEDETVLARIRENVLNGEQDRSKKRKRGGKDEEVEETYMRKLAREEAKDEEKRVKKQRMEAREAQGDESSESEEEDEDSYTIPKHETQMESTGDGEKELEKAARTVFLGNVSSETITSKTAKKTLLRHLASFIDDLADNEPPHKVESLRFRSTAFGSALPKKAAFAKKEIMDATTKSTNAYAVYSTQVAARQAAKRLNGTVVLGRHLRVDSVAHPAKTDNRRCVFVGNLGFVDDESNQVDEDGKKKKAKPPGDVEEGLWVQFSKAGKVESVRVIRDAQTRIGKGFAYVQFEDENGVEAALQFHEQKYPPLLPRKLRVVRAKALGKKPSAPIPRPNLSKPKGVYNAKKSDEQKSKEGRARAMLGKSAAFKTAESFVFEGHRASSKQGHSGLKLGGKKKVGKPQNRGAKRATAWKKSEGKK